MIITMYQIDAFTDHVFGGNPAAVCPLDNWISDGIMQNIAMENNLSETAFFVKSKDGFEIRWFTPTAEIELAGHPTLATAFVIFNHCNFKEDNIKFYSKSGELFVAKDGDRLKMNFPSTPPVKAPKNSLLDRALGKKPSELYYTRDYLAVFNTE